MTFLLQAPLQVGFGNGPLGEHLPDAPVFLLGILAARGGRLQVRLGLRDSGTLLAVLDAHQHVAGAGSVADPQVVAERNGGRVVVGGRRRRRRRFDAVRIGPVAAFSRIVEPVMLLVMGVVVGLIVSSLILPIFKLSRAAG